MVELLVVVSIIAILISLLMPALSNARDAAKNIHCQSNLHQWGIAFNMYASDFTDTLPPPYAVEANSYLTTQPPWSLLVEGEYVPDNTALFCCPGNTHDTFGYQSSENNRTSYYVFPDVLGRPLQYQTPYEAWGGDHMRYPSVYPEIHKGKGFNVMYSDGGVTFVSTKPVTEWFDFLIWPYPPATRPGLSDSELGNLRRILTESR